MKLYILSFLAGLCLNGFANDTTHSFQSFSEWQEVLNTAKAENKLVLVDCYFTGCFPCAQMDREVFPNKMVKAEMEKNFVSIKVDVFKEALGDSLNIRYALSGFPSFLILDAKGRLIDRISGFKDAGNFMKVLVKAQELAKENKFLTGFPVTYESTNYTNMYTTRYKREGRADAEEVSGCLKEQKDPYAVPVAMLYLTSTVSAEVLDAFFLENFKQFLSRFGEELCQKKLDELLVKNLTQKLGDQKQETVFKQFIRANAELFPAENWEKALQSLGSAYYLGMQKDTAAYLNFAIAHPILYTYHFNVLSNEVLLNRESAKERISLYGKWANKIVDEESPLTIILQAARVHEKNGNVVDYQRFVKMAIQKARKYSIDSTPYEKMLEKAG